VAVLGVAIGLSAFGLHYAEGLSYLSDRSEACANCHIMQPQFDAWQKASHHGVATCGDCHLPASGLRKYWAKAVNGYHHSKAFTFQDFPEPIRITPRNAALLEENCLRCHAGLVHDQVAGSALSGDRDERDTLRCVHCHRSVGHGEAVGLGGAPRDDEGGTR
jgi:cytochrome c nitrite reductase small subunit